MADDRYDRSSSGDLFMSTWISSRTSMAVMATYVLVYLVFIVGWIALTPAEKHGHPYLFPVIMLACIPPLFWGGMRKKAGQAPAMLPVVRAHPVVSAVILAVVLTSAVLLPMVLV